MLKNYLSNIGFKDCRKVFADVIEDDTVGVNSEGKAFKKIDLSRWYIIKFDNKNILDSVRKKLLNGNDVEFACPVVKWNVETEPNDPYYVQGYQTGLKNGTTGRDIHVYDAWNYSTGRSDVKIAVVDAGVDYTHPDLDPGNRSRVIAGYDFGDNDNNPMDDIPSQYQAASHGTLVAGVIGAITNNNYGVAGIMQNLQIIPVKVFGTSGPWWDTFSWDPNSSYDPWIANGINYAANNGAKVINLSLGGPGLSGWENLLIGNPVGEATYNAYHQGVLLVAAAGNNGSNAPFYPADFVGVMSVAAVDNNDNRASFSNYGNFISVCAPGNYYENYSTKRGNSFDYFAGTSCSAPMVSGSAGLVISEALDRGISFTNDDVKHLLEQTAQDLGDPGWDQYYGYGRINVGRAVERLNPPYSVITQTIYNSGGQLVWDSHAHQFYNNAGLATGNYYGVKQYKVSGHITFPTAYTSTPYVWVRDRDCVGWNYANPNLELPWIKITNVTTAGFDYETVIYYIGYNSIGQSINKYWPGNSGSWQAKITYTAIGIKQPLSVSISGPTHLIYGQNYTWTANATGGNSPYHYQWYYQYADNIILPALSVSPNLPPRGVWYSIGTDSPALTAAFPTYPEILLKCVVTDAASAQATSIISLTVGASKIGADQSNTAGVSLPTEFSTGQNYPNPFNPSTKISYAIPSDADINIKVYDMLGREVKELLNEHKAAGYYTIDFNASNFSSGIYLYRITARQGDAVLFTQSKRMILLK